MASLLLQFAPNHRAHIDIQMRSQQNQSARVRWGLQRRQRGGGQGAIEEDRPYVDLLMWVTRQRSCLRTRPAVRCPLQPVPGGFIVDP